MGLIDNRYMPIALNLDSKSKHSFYDYTTYKIKGIKLIDLLIFNIGEVSIRDIGEITIDEINKTRSPFKIHKDTIVLLDNKDKAYINIDMEISSNYIGVLDINSRFCIEIDGEHRANRQLNFASIVNTQSNTYNLLELVYNNKLNRVAFSTNDLSSSSVLDSRLLYLKRGNENKLEKVEDYYISLEKLEVDINNYGNSGYRSGFNSITIGGICLIDITGVSSLALPKEYKDIVVYGDGSLVNPNIVETLIIPRDTIKIVWKCGCSVVKNLILARGYRLSAVKSFITSYFKYSSGRYYDDELEKRMRHATYLEDILNAYTVYGRVSDLFNIKAL